MASGSIKGITIEFRGDTTKLDKALRKIGAETKAIDQELKLVDKALKFNPHNIELWQRKQELLKERIAETSEKLKLLQATQEKVDSGEIEMSAEDYHKLRAEVMTAESQLKTFEAQSKKVDNTIRNMDLIKASDKFKQIGTNLESAGQAMRGVSTAAAALVASIGALTVKSGKWADDLNTMSKRYSIGTNELQKYAAASELVDVDVETIAKSHIKLEKTMMSASKGTGASAEAFEKLGVSVTDADGNLRDGDSVWQETIAALGQMSNETERDALAMQLMGKSATDLNPLIEDGGETYKNFADTLAKYDLDFVDQDMLDQANQFNDALDTMKAIGMVAFQQLGTQLAAYLAPAMEKVVDIVGRLANWFSNLSPRTQALIAGIGAVVAVMAPLLIGLGKVSFAISSIMSLMATLGPAIGGIVSAFGPVILIVGAVIAVGVLLYKNWDTIKAKAIAFKNAVVKTFNDFKAKVVSTFNSIRDAIVKPIQTAIDKVKAIIQKIKGFFPISIGKIFSNLKLPHFSISGKFSLNPPSIPKINVDWYKTGGIFDSPSVIGVGEAGAEAVVPLDKFWDKLDKMQGGETNITININGTNKDPREIAEEVKRVLIRETNQRRLAWQ